VNILFDMDGTLLRLDVDIEEVRLRLAALFAPHGVTRPFRPIIQRIKESAAEAGKPELAAVGLRILSDFEVEAAKTARPREGAAEVVEALVHRGSRLGIVTDNGRACVAPALAAAGILPRFVCIVTRDDVDLPKPHPAGVVMARREIGDPLWYVADHPKDITAGHAAGVRVAALSGGLVSVAGADRVIDRLADVLQLD
jgi:phosphoglycolate phosphatase